MHSRTDIKNTEPLRYDQAHPIAAILQTRLGVSFAILALAHLTTTFESPARISWILTVYIVLTVLLVLLFSTVLDRKRVRAIPILFDLLAISLILGSSGGLESPWFLLYLFPTMSASRYLGPTWTVMIAVLSALSYGTASYILAGDSVLASYLFWLSALTLGGVAFTAANLVKTKDRAEARLVKAVEQIDREILRNTDLTRVMGLILKAAMDVTDSDLSAIVLVDGEKITGTFSASKRLGKDTPGGWEQDKSEADRLVQQHYRQVLRSQEPLSLPEQNFTTFFRRNSPGRGAHWPGRLVPMKTEETPFGVLGVFSRRRLHLFTPNDLRKLSSMSSLVAIAHKNAKLVRDLAARELEVKERLQMLYKIGEQLKAEQGLDQVFQDVVALVSARIGSEEAALFVPDDQEEGIEKVAVSGPDEETTSRLYELERSYQGGKSLTWQVFKSKESRLENDIPLHEAYADVYSKQLPSRTARHYMGVPLLIGDEVLGAIRVLNKKAESYSPQTGEAKLAEEGFTQDDFELLTLIATQVASAIRNAKFIERNRYFENLVYNSPDPIIVLDKEGNIKNFNKECEKIWGLSESNALNQPIENYYESAEHAKEIGRALWKAKDHTIRDYNARIRDVDGKIIPILLSATLLLDKADQIIGSIGVFKDERDMLRLQEEKLRDEKLAALGRVAQTTGHDIKHDIATIMNYLDTLEEDPNSDPDTLHAYSAIRGATMAVLNKMQNLLMTAKPKAPQKQIVSLKDILMEFEASVAHQASVAHIMFSAKYPECDAYVLAEPEQMRQVLANLFGNSLDAIKAARAKDQRSAGQIEFELEVGKDLVLLSWRDDGCGMPEEAQRKAFTAFFTTKNSGSGLGLFITKTIIENHGGHITVEPAGASGICFQIILPVFQDNLHAIPS